MQRYEYKVIATPRKLKRVRGVKGPQAQFAHLLTETMNEYANDGWEYVRSESLPIDEKQGLFKGSIETYQSVLVFRRALEDGAATVAPAMPTTTETVVEEPVEQALEKEPAKAEDFAPSRLEEAEIPTPEEAADPLVQVVEEQRRD